MIQVTNGSKDHIDSVNKVTIMLSHQNWAVQTVLEHLPF